MTNSNFNFRLATVEDATKLESLINAAFSNDTTTQVFLSANHPSVNVTDITTLTAKITEPKTTVLVCTNADGEIVSHCSVRKLDGKRAWFGMLAVDVHFQKCGLGSQALAYAENYARREWGSQRMEFDVVCTRVELIAWYTRQGYRATGETKPFPYEYHGDWKGVLRDDLHFKLLGKDLI
jgi:ribosomal protein S18 acetylase RimI-like enzyme